MTRMKAYRTMMISLLLMMLAIIFYALDVSKMDLSWGITGFSIASLMSIFAIILSISSFKHQNEVTKTGFFHTHRFEILDWFSFFSISLMIIFLLFTFIILPSDVDQNSMYPTLKPNDRILIYHYQYQPKRDDIVIIKITKEDYPLVLNSMFNEYDSHGSLIRILDTIYFVKRVKAIPGDVIDFVLEIDEYYITVNGNTIYTPTGEKYYVKLNQKLIMESYLTLGVLDEGKYMTFGDNPNGFTYIDPTTSQEVSIPGSFDSRSFGAVNEKDIVGKVIYRLWPFGGLS